ncbi:MAG: tripartite tricarboxylate transporter substrate binding protein [Burkholderiales bacterium]
MPPLIARITACALLCAATATHAQPAWKPEKSVEIIIGTSPGGPQDHMGRVLQKVLQESRLVDVPVSVENKPGGGGSVALAALGPRKGGSTLMINAPTMLSNQITGRTTIPYTEFTALAILGIEYECVVVRADSPLKSGKDLIERLKKDPASLSVSIGTSLGNSGHLAFALAMKAAGVDIKKLKTVAFNSAGDGITALLGGHIDLASTPPSAVLQHVQGGKLRVLALTSPTRARGELANVPTWKELGVNSTHEVWRGVVGPRGMTPAQIAYWDDVLGKLAKNDAWQKDLDQSQIENIYRNSAETVKYLKAQYEESRGILTDLGLAKQ